MFDCTCNTQKFFVTVWKTRRLKPTVKPWTQGTACVGCHIYTDDKIAFGFTVDFYKLATAHTFFSPFCAHFYRIYTFVSSHANIFGIHRMNSSRAYTLPLKQKFLSTYFSRMKVLELGQWFFFYCLLEEDIGKVVDETHTHTDTPHTHTHTHTHTCMQPFVGKVRQIKENWIYLQNYRKSKSTSGSLQRRLSVRAGGRTSHLAPTIRILRDNYLRLRRTGCKEILVIWEFRVRILERIQRLMTHIQSLFF